MNWQAISFDWNQVRAFLATVEEGSLSAAARALGLTQPTLSRQVTALEERLGVVLFERGPRTMILTTPGLQLLEHVRAMGDAANRISLAASGQSQAIEGSVKIASTNTMATYHLPEILRGIRAKAPGIEIEITTSNRLQDLAQREADIAIRHARPTQPELIAKLIVETKAHMYAATSLLDRVGRPSTIDDLRAMDFIGFEHAELLIPVYRERFGLELSRRNFPISTESGTAIGAMVACGLGIGALVDDDARRFPNLERVLPDELASIAIPVWLVTHRELHTSRRIRLVYDHLAEQLSAIAA